MFLRLFTFLIFIVFCTSCDKFSFSKSQDLQNGDTIVDFTSVDFSPTFKICDSIIDKEEIAICFRNTMHAKIGAELQKYPLIIKDSIDEVVYAKILISSKGKIVLKEIVSTKNLQQQLPELDSLLRVSVKNLSPIYPAIKRGIPVTTMYSLKLRILLRD
jgi:hypothetical protein